MPDTTEDFGTIVLSKEGNLHKKESISLVRASSVLGRARKNDSDATIPLGCADVSSRHCSLHVTKGDTGEYICIIQDLGSSNGTKVNGVKINNRKVELKSGDSKVQLASAHITWFSPTDKSDIGSSKITRDSSLPIDTSLTVSPTPRGSPKKRKKPEEPEKAELFTPEPCQDYPDAVYTRFDGTLWGIAAQPSSRDLSQGSLNNCYLVAALGVLADKFGSSIQAAIRPFDPAAPAAGSPHSNSMAPPPPSMGPPRSMGPPGITGKPKRGTGNVGMGENLFEVTFKLPSRGGRRRSSGAGVPKAAGEQRVEKVIVDDFFFVEDEEMVTPKKKSNKKKKIGAMPCTMLTRSIA
jgi:hypothetical protein